MIVATNRAYETVYSWLPTRALLWQTRWLPDGKGPIWAVLTDRPLTPSQQAVAYNRLLTTVNQGRPISYVTQMWLYDLVSSQTTPSGLFDRYAQAMLIAKVFTPSHVPVNHPFNVRLGVREVLMSPVVSLIQRSGLPTENCIDVAGVYPEGGPITGRAGKPAPHVCSLQFDPHEYFTVYSTTLTLTHLGAVRVHLVYWLLLGNPRQKHIQWTGAGKPKIPTQTRWSHRFELTKIIHVTP